MKAIPAALSAFLTSQLFSITALVFSLYVLFAVPQISNLWMQWPPFSGGWMVSVLFIAFVAILFMFYGGSLVLNYDWKRYGQESIRSSWILDDSKLKTSYIWKTILFLPRIASEWLNSLVFGRDEIEIPISKPRKFRLLLTATASLGVGLLIFLLGATRIGSRGYTLAGAYCQLIGVWFSIFGVWVLLIRVFTKTSNHPYAVNLIFHAGRVMGWILATSVVGELLWIAACNEVYYLSFRLFSIWAMIETLVAIILMAQWLDSASQQLTGLVRLAAVGVLVGVVWTTTHSDIVDSNEVKQHLSAQRTVLTEKSDDKKLDKLWFDTFENRLSQIQEGPFVFLAASGGGSRAAIFTSLCLSLLERTPLDPKVKLIKSMNDQPRPRTWADQIVMVSSVSGGSLASAYWLQRWGEPGKEVSTLVHSTKKELLHYLELFSKKSFMDFPKIQLLQGQQQHFAIVGADRASFLAKKWLAVIKNMEKETNSERRLEYASTQILELIQSREELKKSLLALINSRPSDANDKRSNEVRQQQIEFVNTINGSLDQFFACYWSYRYFYMLNKVDADETELDKDMSPLSATEKEILLRYRWIFRNSAFDAMCTDFMAPLFRGVLAPTLDRGDALAKFWTERFGWQDCTNLRGFMTKDGESPYSQGRPLAVFNACDAAMGCRLAIGFPDLPQDLWRSEFVKRPEYSLPETYREVAKPVELSLARAVRFSSNFPFGFRAQQLETISKREKVHVLDGGVSDNTGVDTIRELLGALENHASNHKSPYVERARSIMESLKLRGVVILEIDSGGKPSEALPHGPLAGIFLPVQALNNAAYSTASIAKTHYYSEIERLLKCSKSQFATNLILPGNPKGTILDEELGVPYFQLPSIFVETVLQCNHYNPGKKEREADVMTAWSLGPKDKADVVGRFLQELTHWEGKRELLNDQFDIRIAGFTACKKLAETSIAKARIKVKLDTLLNNITRVLSSGETANGNDVRATIDKLNTDARAMQVEIDTVVSLPDMDDVKQWGDILAQSILIMNTTREQIHPSKTSTSTTKKVLESAKKSFDLVKQNLSISKPDIVYEASSHMNALQHRDAQVRQYYGLTKHADDKTELLLKQNKTPGTAK